MGVMTPNIEIVIGTYEEFLLGYKLDDKNEKRVLKQSFADKSHNGALKCVAVQGNWVASGATDDRIFIYDMRFRKQSQIILTHEGTVNALAFTPDGTHLLSGADDGRMVATRLNTWFTEANWKKAHDGAAVTHITCHPSGKLALSLGADNVLRTWNLVKGRVAYKTNLKSKNTLGRAPEGLAWSPGGEYFTLCGQLLVQIWSIKSADVIHFQKTTAKPICVVWIANEACLVGLENGNIQSVHLKIDKEMITEAHQTRVKAMAFHNGVLVTASSAGELKMWEVNASTSTLREIAATNTGCRPTCLGIIDLQQFGASYNNAKSEQQETSNIDEETKKNHNKTQNRGVVTIEYESSISGYEEVREEAQNDDKIDDADSSDDSQNSNENIEESLEPQIRLPKSRKRKHQILKSQNMAKKETAKLLKQKHTKKQR